MHRLAILTPDPADEGYRSRWREVLARLVAPLIRTGVAVEPVSWTASQDLRSFDLVLPLLVWGYHRARRQWHDRIAVWEEGQVKLRNPASVLRWNADKLYLSRLAKLGAPVVPTHFAERLTVPALAAAAAEFNTDRLVVKPQVSASAWQTIRWTPGGSLDGGPAGPAMIQPFLPDIVEGGEISLVWLGRRFSHAIRKRPQPGDFRVQPEYDGIISRHEPAADELAAAEAILAAVEEELLYARIDLVRGLDGRPVLMELELVEPDLYLEYDAAGGTRWRDAILAALRSS
ncbi:MAG TPA: hypothetical protein VGW34_14020 [Allosphingosinicella sp.]|nr:hypothetical protein [Allosphingosinicella sp.]